MQSAAQTATPGNSSQVYTRPEESMGRGLKISLAFHLGVAVLIIFKSLVFPGNPVVYIPSLRVDLVGLPDQLKQEHAHPPAAGSEAKPAPAEKTPPQKPKEAAKPVEEAKPDEMVLKPTVKSEAKMQEKAEKAREKKLENALNRIKALSKLSGDPTSDVKAANPSVPLKGNKVSKGGSTSGEARESDKEDYIGTLQNSLQENWELPMYLERQELNAQVMIFIDATGRMIQFKFVRSSGNPQFDEAIKRTLMKSQPFPLPPPDIASELESHGVLVGFPL